MDNKHASLEQEVQDMQTFIDELSEENQTLRSELQELDQIKQSCYNKIDIIQAKSKESSSFINDPEAEK